MAERLPAGRQGRDFLLRPLWGAAADKLLVLYVIKKECFSLDCKQNGGTDGTRTRDLLRDRQAL